MLPVVAESAVDGPEFFHSGEPEAFDGPCPQLDVGVHRIFHIDLEPFPLLAGKDGKGVRKRLHGEWVGAGSRSDPYAVYTAFYRCGEMLRCGCLRKCSHTV
jgi:hypothetical protein